jgi:DNA-binding NarL/FixJ family response regulator
MPATLLPAHRVDSPDDPWQPRRADLRLAGPVRVAIAHGQRLVRAGLRALLEREAGILVVDEASTGDEVVALAQRLRPDVLLIDVQLPGLGCVEATRRILAGGAVPVMVLTPSESDARVFATLRAGAVGLLLEDHEPTALILAVRRLGHEGRARRPRNPRCSQPLREVPMPHPHVIDIARRRGGI